MVTTRPRILSVGTALPPRKYTQEEVLRLMQSTNPAVREIFLAAHIQTRHLYLPVTPEDGSKPRESQSQLLAKMRRGAMEIAPQAIARCLEQVDLKTSDIDFLCCITSSGLMLPGLTAMMIRHFGFRVNCHRMDIVGMGCNAGLNGLNPVSNWAAANPGKNALMVCCEINSALYIDEDTVSNGVVNSLFGDGCAAVLLRADEVDEPRFAPQVLGFYSHIIPETWAAMHYEWSERHGKYFFYLDRDVPYVLGTHAATPVAGLLERFGLKRRHIQHWLIHSGGKKVIDAIKYTVGITEHDVRHTAGVLRECGNLSSGSFLFSYERLMREKVVQRGDYGVMMTMGPGSTIETALLRW